MVIYSKGIRDNYDMLILRVQLDIGTGHPQKTHIICGNSIQKTTPRSSSSRFCWGCCYIDFYLSFAKFTVRRALTTLPGTCTVTYTLLACLPSCLTVNVADVLVAFTEAICFAFVVLNDNVFNA